MYLGDTMKRNLFIFFTILLVSQSSISRESLLNQMKTHQAERQQDSEKQLRAFDTYIQKKDAEEAQARAQVQKELALNTIKTMYAQSRQRDGDDLISYYADPALKRAFTQGCISYSMMWQTNGDRNIYDPVQFTQPSTDTIQVKLYDRSWINYKMSCSADSCKISDASDKYIKSLKRSLQQGCEYD